MPCIDDIFAKLAGGQKFTKIYLRQAYHQMEVEGESQEYSPGIWDHFSPSNLAEIYVSNLRRGRRN